MKLKYLLAIASLVIAASALAACNHAGPYASAPEVFSKGGPSMAWTSLPSGYQTLTNPHGATCGPDIQVCHYEKRDARDRGQQ